MSSADLQPSASLAPAAEPAQPVVADVDTRAADSARLIERADRLLAQAAAGLQGDLDGEQIELYDLAFCAAELGAARALVNSLNADSEAAERALSELFVADALHNMRCRLSARLGDYGLTADALDFGQQAYISRRLGSHNLRALGDALKIRGSAPFDGTLSDEQRLVRDSFREFADRAVAPVAARIHQDDQVVPQSLLEELKALGCFGLSIPQRFGGLTPDDAEDSMSMVLVTEELSRASLGAAGSLITRPEILARALLVGGTAEQQAQWLPRVASGDTLCAISVTEPGTGSDVANVSLKATRTEGGYLLSGGKTWCTFAGKANVILVLARTDPSAQPPHKGLSLFLVEKPSSDGDAFEHDDGRGGRVSGRAIRTLGYRGMHSFEMFYDDFFVSDAHLIGGAAGLGRGFYHTMRGFMGGRLQTAARACGLMQAAFEAASEHSANRSAFGRPLDAYPLSQAKLARMAASILACQRYTYAVANMMDDGGGATDASLVKLLACRLAESVTREAQQLHGGMGYAEETSVSRYFVDARVLSIFEGAEETLAVRVIGKTLADRAADRRM
ncbi:MAG: acyl-CoA dehydrogenase family protein [Pseudomonadota bacterium]